MQKNIKFHDIQQNTDEWFSIRLGKFTASKCKDLFASKTTATYNNLINCVAFERVTGERPEFFKSDYMLRGNELESDAISEYQKLHFVKCHNGGFFEYNEWVGASPDALVGTDGLVQVKCPSYSTHIDVILTNNAPSEYVKQVQFEMMCTDRVWCDLFFFHPNLKPVIIRVNRDEAFIELIKNELETAIKKEELIIEKIKLP
jgi:exodeoxyribonuclease (lambda-induced)